VESPEDFVVELNKNMNEFLDEFWKEYKRQSKSKNKSSEKRMRILLSSFKDKIQKPYKAASLNKENVRLNKILGENNGSLKNTS
jgi:ferric iron reductase protein FhuF